jgi:hypothetical protein
VGTLLKRAINHATLACKSIGRFRLIVFFLDLGDDYDTRVQRAVMLNHLHS